MRRWLERALLTLMLTITASAAADDTLPLFPRFAVDTSEGRFVVELDGQRAPLTVVNFSRYALDGFYDGLVFHRVKPDFVAQAGGYDAELKERATREPIPNESGNGLRNERGTIAMARQRPPHTATSQFYINLADNQSLDPNPSRWGYTVFGLVVEGMEVLEKIAAIPTTGRGDFASDVPSRTVSIKSVELLNPSGSP